MPFAPLRPAGPGTPLQPAVKESVAPRGEGTPRNGSDRPEMSRLNRLECRRAGDAVQPLQYAHRRVSGQAILVGRNRASGRKKLVCTIRPSPIDEVVPGPRWPRHSMDRSSNDRRRKAVGAAPTELSAHSLARLFAGASAYQQRDLTSKRSAFPRFRKTCANNGMVPARHVRL